PWIADMDIAFVVDESRSYWFVSRELAAQWDQRPEELRTLALKNLDRHFLEHPVEFAFSEDASPRMIAPTEPNAYNSTRLLSEPFRGKLREMLGGDFALGMPSREFFVAISLESSEAIAKVRRQVAEDHARRDHPLCEHLLLVSADGISEYVEET